jgi:hypothetical protein
LPLSALRIAASLVLYRHFSSAACGVAHDVNWACLGNWSSLVRSVPSGLVPVVAIPGESFQSRVLGVAHGDTFAASAGSAPPA